MSNPNNITGLPKLPKVLSVVANTANYHWQDSGKIYAAQIAMKTVSFLSAPIGDKRINPPELLGIVVVYIDNISVHVHRRRKTIWRMHTILSTVKAELTNLNQYLMH